jgi:hypothetical protein
MRKFTALAAGLLACSATPASAAQFIFNFTTSTPLIGGRGSGSGVITTNDVTIASRGFTAQTITGITGTFNGSTITGLGSLTGANNLYYLTGPSFVDGSGLGFITAAGTSVNLFFQDSQRSFRINTTGPFTSSLVSASSSVVAAAVPEPGTWLMMLAGFGIIGMGLRFGRRNRSRVQAATI